MNAMPFFAGLAKLVLPYAIDVRRGPGTCRLCWGHMILEWGTLTTLETTCTNFLSSAEEACVFWQSFYLFESWILPEDYANLPVTHMYFFVSITDIYVPVHHLTAIEDAYVYTYKQMEGWICGITTKCMKSKWRVLNWLYQLL